MLSVTDGPWRTEYNAVHSNIADLEELEKRFGIGHVCIGFREFFAEMDRVLADKSLQKLAGEITDSLMENATENHMTRENIIPSVNYYLTVKKLMAKHGCNAFTATCQELCVAGYPQKYKVTPCLTHTLLKDQGYPSSCEGDTNVLTTMMMQIYLTRKSPYMGNTLVRDRGRNIVSIHHDVPGIRMKGIDAPGLPYEIRKFTERGWGATVRYDFSRDRGEDVTFCRLNPAATKLMTVCGKLEGCYGLDDWSCSLGATITVADAMEYFHTAVDFGHHFSMIYGDCTDRLEMLTGLLGIDIVRV